MYRSKFAHFSVLVALGCGSDDANVVDGSGTETSTEANQPTAGEAALVARGQYLVDNVVGCPDCHTPRDPAGAPILTAYLSGAECFVQLPNQSCLHSRNLTNHETGLLNRTSDEIKQMITEGVRPSATGDVALSPIMPYYLFHNLASEDLDAVVAYLRTVPGVDHEVPRSGVEFEVPAPANPLDPNAIPMPMAGYVETERALRGRYLATESGACIECHTRHIMNDPNVLDYTAFFQGGEQYPIGAPVVPVSTNLTSDPETGLGNWSVEDIVKVLKQGTDKDGDGICPPMPAGGMNAYAGLLAEDALDIAHYIKSLPPAVNAVDDQCTWPLPM
jgi:mono/diheme cytochrome c family protein